MSPAKNITLSLCLLAVACALLGPASPARAQTVNAVKLREGLNLGGTSFFDGFGRMEPGFVWVQFLRYNHLTAMKDNAGQDVTAVRSPRIDSYSLTTQVFYFSPVRFLDASLGAVVTVPLLGYDSSFGQPGATLQDNGLGFGDPTFGVLLQWAPLVREGRPVFSHRLELDAIAPLGKFSAAKDINQSAGYWSFSPHWDATVLPIPQWEISWRVSYVYNLETDRASNPPSVSGFVFRNGQAGQAIWLNYASSYAVASWLRLGVNGFALQQLSDNVTNGQDVPASMRRQVYLGPGASLKLAPGRALNLNAYLPISVRNATSGVQFNARYAHTF